jgi:hypothetical protein
MWHLTDSLVQEQASISLHEAAFESVTSLLTKLGLDPNAITVAEMDQLNKKFIVEGCQDGIEMVFNWRSAVGFLSS